MTDLIMPITPGFTDSTFLLETNTQSFESPLTKSVQRVALGGARWNAVYTLPKMNRDQAAPWRAFLLSLVGRSNTFAAYDPDYKSPRGVATGAAPAVNGVNQIGASLITDGWTASIKGILKIGDYFSVNGELKCLTQDANSDSGGNATLVFQPPIRNSPGDNIAIVTTKPTCSMILADDKQATWSTNNMGIYNPISFSAMEVFA